MLSLEDFVRETLVQIVQGVKSAQETVAELGAEIAPLMDYHKSIPSSSAIDYGLGFSEGRSAKMVVRAVEFDVALTTVSGSEAKGGIAVFGGMVSMGATGKSNDSTQAVSHVKFIVPLLLSARKTEPANH